MKKFILKLLYFVSPIFILVILIEVVLRMTPNDYSYKKQYLDKHASELEILILGNSHLFYGLNPKYFSYKTFNASHISQSLDYDYEVLKMYQNKLNKLKALVLPISYFSLFWSLDNSNESWRKKNYVIYYGMNTSDSITDYSEVLSNRLDINFKRIVLHYLLGYPAISCNRLGWGVDFKSTKSRDLKESGIRAAKRHTISNLFSNENEKIFKDNLNTLSSIMRWCEVRKIKLILITPPAYISYRQGLNQEQLSETMKAIETFCNDKSNCYHKNYLTDKVFTAGDYYDSDHLSEIGAKKLSQIVDEEIVKIVSVKK